MHDPSHLDKQEDGDDDVYEDLLPLPPPPPRSQPQLQGGYSWDAVHVSQDCETASASLWYTTFYTAQHSKHLALVLGLTGVVSRLGPET